MRLTHLGLRNWRNFPKAEIPLSPRTFVYGPNASGKSNFLDVFRFLKDIAREEGGLQRAVGDRNGFGAIRSLHAHGRHQQIEIDVQCRLGDADWRYFLSLDAEPKTKRAIVLAEKVERDGKVLSVRPTKADKADPALLRETHLESLRANQEFRPLAEAFAAFSYMHIVPHVVKFPERAPADGAAEMGAHLLKRVARASPKQRNAQLKRVNKALQVALPQFQDLQFEQDPSDGTPHLKVRYANWRPKGSWQREDQFSDGTLRLLGLLWELAQPGDVLLLEEPELSLHSALVQQLPRVLSRVTRNKQVIFSSHSQELVSDKGVDPSEVVLLRPSGNGTEVSVASRIAEVVEVAEADGNIGPVITGYTRPDNAEQLSLYGR